MAHDASLALAVRQGETLVVVHASAEQEEQGLDMLHGLRAGDLRESVPHGSPWAI